MPSRIVREGINSSARINALSPLAELFYRRLMSVADDHGRYYGAPDTLRCACWPTCPKKFREGQIMEWLKECSDGNDALIVLYEVNACSYLQITNFGQQIRGKSKFPDCLSIAKHPCTDDKQVISNCEANAQPSRIRISESKTESDTTPVAKTATDVCSISEADPIAEWFNREFWPIYPRHTAKAHGLEAARAKLKTEQERAEALSGLMSQLPEMKTRDPSKIPHPATWINGRRWEDEVQLSMMTNGNGKVIPDYKPGREVPRYERPVD